MVWIVVVGVVMRLGVEGYVAGVLMLQARAVTRWRMVVLWGQGMLGIICFAMAVRVVNVFYRIL